MADKLLDHVSQFVNKGYVKTPYLYVLYKLYAIDNIKKNQYETARLNIDKAIDLCKQVYERKGLGELYAWASIIARKDKNEKEALSYLIPLSFIIQIAQLTFSVESCPNHIIQNF